MKFGTDGIRGPAGAAPIDPASAVRVGRAAARLAVQAGDPRVLIAHDTRPSGPSLAAAVAAGVAAGGAVARSAGVAPTPALAVALADGGGGAGVMVTASHNPWTDNGFKLLCRDGSKPDDSTSAQLEVWLADDTPGQAFAGIEDAAESVRHGWLARLAAVPLGNLRGRALGIDLAAGAAQIARPWLEALGCEVHFVDGERINEGVGSEHPSRLQQLVRERGCFAGVAVDGDGDRCLLVDGEGRVVHGDALTWSLACALAVPSLAVTQMSTGALQDALPQVRIVVTPVGDKHLQAAMRAEALPLAAEESGHVLFADHPGGDGLLAGLRALAAVPPGVTLSEHLSPFQPWPRVKSKLVVHDRVPLDELPALTHAVRAAQGTLGSGGRVFLRYSGTEPALRLLVEGREPDAVARAAADVEAVARELLCD